LKVLRFTITVTSVFLLFTALASAQTRVDAYFGMGTLHVGSTNQSVDLLGTGTPAQTGPMGGVFGTFGGAVMLKPHFGVGGEMSLRFAQGDYAGLGYRPIFYDFNGIWTPSVHSKHIMPEFQGGFGGVNLRFYGGGQSCDPFSGTCSDFAGSSNHLQLHASAGLRIYLKEHLFVRPQYDYHWVRNLTEFASNNVSGFSIAVGYSSGER
jgi:hypothetical protein